MLDTEDAFQDKFMGVVARILGLDSSTLSKETRLSQVTQREMNISSIIGLINLYMGEDGGYVQVQDACSITLGEIMEQMFRSEPS